MGVVYVKSRMVGELSKTEVSGAIYSQKHQNWGTGVQSLKWFIHNFAAVSLNTED